MGFGRFLLARSERFEFDETIAKILDEPTANESEWLDAVQKASADEEVLHAAAAYARVREALPAEVLKLLEPETRTPEERRQLAEDAARANERIQKHYTRIEKERVEKERRANRTVEETLAEFDTVMKSIEILEDKRALERIDEAAARLRKSDPSLGKSQAVVKAMENDPSLYAAYTRHQGRQQGWLDDSPETIRKEQSAYGEIETAAAAIKKAHPEMTEAQATEAALRNDPTLYTRYLGA